MELSRLMRVINDWLTQEQTLGSSQPNRIVLATAGKDGIPHSRIVAIREISSQGILFFTQRGTRKTREISENPNASMTLWLPLQQREVMVEGRIRATTAEENALYWSKKPRESQLRFLAYAGTSGQPLNSLQVLEQNYQRFEQQFRNESAIPLSEAYCGYWLLPDKLIFYTLNDDAFSEVIRYEREGSEWVEQRLSP